MLALVFEDEKLSVNGIHIGNLFKALGELKRLIRHDISLWYGWQLNEVLADRRVDDREGDNWSTTEF